ncbi:hypothetical protein SAMN04487968_101427 [Nocardioides terrae]|uniref:Uncharacterized protein n=1 Tax=Nocardioides terrae TaxID=574651 RepID=A0A1I1DRH6_9ACTN|nr:hypothetical protein [Nocardioides terrae]SFB77022.1 hypothetical protein SAMN04487968_101427 [Nocardioides terrae]
MKRTFLSRVGGAVVALGLGTATLAAVGTATPASAATTATVQCTDTVQVAPSYTTLEFGRTNSVDATASGSCPGYTTGRLPYGTTGNLLIQTSADGVNWATVGGNTSAGSAYASVPATGSVLIRAYRPEGTYTDGSDVLKFPAAASAPVRFGVYRAVDMKFRGGHGSVKTTFTVKPAASVAGLKVPVQIKKGKHWKKYKKIKFHANGRFVGRFGKTGHYRLVLPTTRGLDGFTYGFKIWRY